MDEPMHHAASRPSCHKQWWMLGVINWRRSLVAEKLAKFKVFHKVTSSVLSAIFIERQLVTDRLGAIAYAVLARRDTGKNYVSSVVKIFVVMYFKNELVYKG